MNQQIASDLQIHLSKRLQATIREHADRAAVVLDPAEVMSMLLTATVEANCCSIATVAASLANASGAGIAQVNILLETLIARQNDMLTASVPVMIEKISAAVTAQQGRRA